MLTGHVHEETTGIRPEDTDPAFFAEHQSAYAFARRIVAGKRVLEVGFGDGYGAHWLAELAREVMAIDTTAPNIPIARQKYPRANLRFELTDGKKLPFPDGSFDVVCSFQVIEHIPEPQLPVYLAEISRVLAPDGAFCVSTLNLDHNRKPGRPYEKLPCHEKEFTGPELQALLSTAFPSVEMFGLYETPRHRVFRRLKKWGLERWQPANFNPVAQFYRRVSVDDFTVRQVSPQAIDLYALCRKHA